MKVTLSDIVNLENQTSVVNTINSNSAVIETAFDNTLSRNGAAPNQMLADFDMNSNRILNLPVPVNDTEPLRRIDGITAGLQGPVGPAGPAGSIANFEIAPYMLTNGELLIDTLKEGVTPYNSSAAFENWAVDGFRIYGAGGTPGSFAIQQVNNVGPNKTLPCSLWIRPGTQNTAPTAGDNYHIEQWIIPSLCKSLELGTANARAFTFSFYIACGRSPLTFCWNFMPADNSRSFVGVTTYNAPANNFQRLSVTVPADNVLNTAFSTAGMKIVFDLGFGSNFELSAPSVAWANGASFRVVGSYSYIRDPSPPAIFITGEQIDFGTQMLPFRNLDFQTHLDRCRMFKYKLSSVGVVPTGSQGVGSGVTVLTPAGGAITTGKNIDFPVEMYGIPIANLFNPRSGGNPARWSGASGTVDSGVFQPAYGASTRGCTLLNNGAAGDGPNQINEISGWFGACPGNVGVGTGCSLP